MNLNKVYIIGRVTNDIDFRTIPSGATVASFGVATNRFTKDPAGNRKEFTEFHNVVLWRRLAEIANQYLTKGSLVMIEGRLQTRNWEGKDGITRYRTEIIGENMQLGPRSGQGGGNNAPAMSNDTPPPPDADAESTAPSSDKSEDGGDEEIKVEDIPF